MSGDYKNDNEDYEVVFGDDSDGHKAEAIDYQDVDFAVSKPHQASPQDEENSFDDEEGIFAPEEEYRPSNKKKTSSVVSALMLAAVLGAGGYVVYSNPQIVNQIKQNFDGSFQDVAPAPELQAVAGLAHSVVPPASEQSSVAPDAMNPESAEVPPESAATPPSVGVPPITEGMPAENPVATGEGIAAAEPPAGESVSTNDIVSVPSAPPPLPETPPAPEDGSAISASESPVVSPAVAEITSSQSTPESTEKEAIASLGGLPVTTPENPAPLLPVAVPSAPSSESSPGVPAVEKTDSTKIAETDPTPAKPAEVKTAEQLAEASAEKPVVDLPSTPKPVVKKEDLFSKGVTPVVVQSKDEKQAIAKAKTNVYFDAPKGKILKDLPAPSLDTKRGKNESIIVVTRPAKIEQPKRSTSRRAWDDDSAYRGYTPTPDVKVEPNALDGKVTSASRALKLGRYDAAQEMYDELYRLNPRDGRILMGRAVLFQQTGQTARAIAAYEEVLNVDPNNAEAIVNLAGLVRKEHPAVALGKLIDLRQAHPDNPYVTAQLGVAYADSGNFEDAQRYLQMAAGLQPQNPKHYFNMAVVAERGGNPAQAVAFYEKALEVDAMYGDGRGISREKIYDRLSVLRGR